MSKPLLLALPLLTLAACATGEEQAAPLLSDTEAYIDREILVGLDGAEDGVREMQLEQDYGLSTVDSIEAIGVARLAIAEEGKVREVAALLEDDHRVDFAEPNYLVKAAADRSDDAYVAYQWNMDQINAWEAWDYADGSGTVVAVLDTGVSEGPDGFGGRLLQGYDAYYGDYDPSDKDGHGTFVAGTIAQATGNGVGVAGVAPGAQILPVKVLGDNGYGSSQAVSNGVVWAADNGADVINMSLGSNYSSQTERRAMQYAYERDVVLVAATGNEYASYINYPAALDEVIAVGASRVDGSRAPYSNRGTGIELMAPGGDLQKDANGDGYADGVLQETKEYGQWTYTFWEGTSMATPHVAAAAALLKSAGVNDPDEIRSILAQTATDRGDSGYDTTYGYGVIDVEAALQLVFDGNGGSDQGGDSGGADQGGDDGTTDLPDEEASTELEITDVSGYTNGTRFTLEWTTNVEASSYIEFEDYGIYGDDDLVTSHSLTFTGQYGSTYVFRFVSEAADGQNATSDWYQISL